MSIHPLYGKNKIAKSYQDFLASSFPISNRTIEEAFINELSMKDLLSKGPYLEVTAPYKKGATITDLVEIGELSPRFLSINQQELPSNRQLYTHQEKAIEKANLNKNFVVSTGTGSGKTEAFMMPILNALFKEIEEGTLNAGVRALFVYPMNALANDQMKRLRSLLKDTPEITFGRYTGETEQFEAPALSKFESQNPGVKRIPNELLSRSEIRKNPPHILVTNYAMLEYLLLRPTDTDLFEGPYSNQWRFIVLDEVHSYNGANGIEIGMLLRRLKDRVLKNRPFNGSLQCIATSATLGSGAEAKRKVLQFAQNIFDEPFDYVSEMENDLIVSERIDYADMHQIIYNPDWSIYEYLLTLLEKENYDNHDILKLKSYGLTEVECEQFIKKNLPVNQMLYYLLSQDKNLFDLRDLLKDKPRTLDDILIKLVAKKAKFGEVKAQEVQQGVINLVNLAVAVTVEDTEEPLLPARYHVFIRAIEGCFVRLHPEVKVSLQAKKVDENTGAPFFEIGVCGNCGQVHLIGEIEDDKFVQRKQSGHIDESFYYSAFMLKENDVHEIEDEDENDSGDNENHQTSINEYQMCTACSTVWHASEEPVDCCSSRQLGFSKCVTLLKEDMKTKGHSKCNHCGKKRHNPIKLFLTGSDGPAGVLATALYQQLIADSKEVIINENITEEIDDVFDGLFDETPTTNVVEEVYEPQKLLIFSDSRQEAAYFAPYLDYKYEQQLWRTLMYKAIKNFEDSDGVGLKSWANEVYKLALKNNAYPGRMDEEEKRTMAEEFVMSEFVKGNDRSSLEGMGLVTFEMELPEGINKVIDKVVERFDLSSVEEWRALVNSVFSTIRYMNIVTHLERSHNRSDRMKPVHFDMGLSKEGTDSKTYVKAWIPKRSNARFDYVKRVFINKGMDEEQAKEKSRNILDLLWKLTNQNQFFADFFVSRSGNNVLMHDIWRVRQNRPLYECGSCKIITAYNVSDTCPTNACQGKLHPIDRENINSHYLRTYEQMIPIPMNVKEHTAQLSPDKAADYQEKFVKGEINVLSCSTTFEMGVDVGGLEAVFLRNVPPETANYIQRAGRAGRRKSSVAFVLTFAQRRSHDLNFYQEPENIIAGIIQPPVLKMDNPKILKRHLNSLVLSTFFRENEKFFGTSLDFMGESINGSGPKKLQSFVRDLSPSLERSVERVTPKPLRELSHPELVDWKNDLLLTSDSLMNKVATRYYEDLNEIKKLRLIEIDKGAIGIDKFNRIIKRVTSENLIGFLSTNNIIPKYGFPVDVVEMTVFAGDKDDIRLSRDLSIAIGEYAPGSQIVANGSIYESTGIRKLKGFEVPTLFYTECENCKTYNVVERIDPNFKESIVPCDECHENTRVHKMIIPKFGFTARKLEKAGERKPGRENRSRVFFSEYFYSNEEDVKERQISTEMDKVLLLNDQSVNIKYSPYGKLSVISRGRNGRGYKICSLCGSMVFDATNKHKNMMNKNCEGKQENKHVHLGHEFTSDVLEIEFISISNSPDSWESILYALLNGAGTALGINRRDIDGCIRRSYNNQPTIILFDKVPGGAGYMQEVFDELDIVIKAALKLVQSCQCGKETSCYGCLKDYSNQYCHDTLTRGSVQEFLQNYVRDSVVTLV